MKRLTLVIAPRATEDDMRSPDWCHRHGCMRGQCPEPD